MRVSLGVGAQLALLGRCNFVLLTYCPLFGCSKASFEEAVKAVLTPHDAERILKDSLPKNARNGGTSSLRDKIAAAKRNAKKGNPSSKDTTLGVGIMEFAQKAQISATSGVKAQIATLPKD